MADYFVRNYPTLPVKTDAGVFYCPVSSFLRREFRVKVAWFPDAGTDQEMIATMSKWGEIVGIHREKIRGLFGHYYSGNRIVTLIPYTNIDEVPDFTDMKAHGNTFTVRMTVLGLKARCHNCQTRGHLARDCGACGRCGSPNHSTNEHPPHIPFTTFAQRVKGRRRPPPAYAEGEMDEEMRRDDRGGWV